MEEIIPPVDGNGNYSFTPGSAYDPEEQFWIYTAENKTDFYSFHTSGAQRLPDGNTLICSGPDGYLFEVTPEGEKVWDYQYQGPDDKDKVFKTRRYYPPTVDSNTSLQAREDILHTLDLATIVLDPDTEFEKLSFEEDSEYVTIESDELSFCYPEGIRSDSFNLSIFDGMFLATKRITIDVEPVDDPPVVQPVPSLSLLEDIPYTHDMGPYITDVDTPLSRISIQDDSNFTTIQGLDVIFTYPDGVFTDVVNLTVSDGTSGIHALVVVNVTGVNDPPDIFPISPLNLTEDIPFSLNVTPHISDRDTPLGDLSIMVRSKYATIEGLTINLTYPDGILSDELEVKVFDGEFYNSTNLHVHVTSVNDPPMWKDTFYISALQQLPGEFYLRPFVDDFDTSIEDLEISSDSDFGRIDGHWFRYEYPAGVHCEQVNFTLTDGEFEETILIIVNVTTLDRISYLYDARCTPPTGNTSTKFEFCVMFKGSGQANPTVMVIIDGTEYECIMESGNPADGAEFVYGMTLDTGAHTYHFIARDRGGNHQVTPQAVLFVTNATTVDDPVENGTENDDPDEQPSDEETESDSGISGSYLFTVIFSLLMIYIVILTVFARRKGPSASATEDGDGAGEDHQVSNVGDGKGSVDDPSTSGAGNTEADGVMTGDRSKGV